MQEREIEGCSFGKEIVRGVQEVMVWVNWYVFFRIRFSLRIRKFKWFRQKFVFFLCESQLGSLGWNGILWGSFFYLVFLLCMVFMVKFNLSFEMFFLVLVVMFVFQLVGGRQDVFFFFLKYFSEVVYVVFIYILCLEFIFVVIFGLRQEGIFGFILCSFVFSYIFFLDIFQEKRELILRDFWQWCLVFLLFS